jgi:hypothetical protein
VKETLNPIGNASPAQPLANAAPPKKKGSGNE